MIMKTTGVNTRIIMLNTGASSLRTKRVRYMYPKEIECFPIQLVRKNKSNASRAWARSGWKAIEFYRKQAKEIGLTKQEHGADPKKWITGQVIVTC